MTTDSYVIITLLQKVSLEIHEKRTETMVWRLIATEAPSFLPFIFGLGANSIINVAKQSLPRPVFYSK